MQGGPFTLNDKTANFGGPSLGLISFARERENPLKSSPKLKRGGGGGGVKETFLARPTPSTAQWVRRKSSAAKSSFYSLTTSFRSSRL